MTTKPIYFRATGDLPLFPSNVSAFAERAALACGVAFVALFLVAGFVGGDTPGSALSPEKLADFYRQVGQTQLEQVYVRSLAAFSMLMFVCGADSFARRRNLVGGLWNRLALGGATIFTLIMFASQMANATAVVLAWRDAAPSSIVAMDALGDMMRHLNSFGGALTFGATSAMLLEARAVPRWVGWIGLVCVPVYLAGAAGFPDTQVGWVNIAALCLLPLWPTTTSVALLVRSIRDEHAARR